jgi:hypothetical protein
VQYFRNSFKIFSWAGIATSYGFDGPENEFGWGGGDFPHPFRLAIGSHSLLYNGYRFIPGGAKRPERGVNLSPHPALRLKKE